MQKNTENLNKCAHEHFSNVCNSCGKDMLETKRSEELQSILEMIEGRKRNVPKDPMDMTMREQMEQVIHPVYRPYMSPEESVNNTLQELVEDIKKMI